MLLSFNPLDYSHDPLLKGNLIGIYFLFTIVFCMQSVEVKRWLNWVRSRVRYNPPSCSVFMPLLVKRLTYVGKSHDNYIQLVKKNPEHSKMYVFPKSFTASALSEALKYFRVLHIFYEWGSWRHTPILSQCKCSNGGILNTQQCISVFAHIFVSLSKPYEQKRMSTFEWNVLSRTEWKPVVECD